jgi:hypothetical protein
MNAHLDSARLMAVDLSGTEGLTQVQIDRACGKADGETRLPAGLTWPKHWLGQRRSAPVP